VIKRQFHIAKLSLVVCVLISIFILVTTKESQAQLSSDTSTFQLNLVKFSADDSILAGEKYLNEARKAFGSGEKQLALSYAIAALLKVEASNHTAVKVSVYKVLAEIYKADKIYEQALFYERQLEKLLLTNPSNAHVLAQLRLQMCAKYLKLDNLDQAKFYGEKARHAFKQHNSTDLLQEVDEVLLKIAQEKEDYEQAFSYARQLEASYAAQLKYGHQIAALNNLGFLFLRTGDKRKAVEQFKKATDLGVNISNKPTVLLINLGLAYSKLENDKLALHYYEEALEEARHENDEVKVAEILNYKASHFFLSGRQNESLVQALTASQLALEKRAWKTLLDSYHLLQLIYLKEKKDSKAKEYNSKYDEIIALLAADTEKNLKERADQYQLALANEEQIKAYWSEKEQNALSQERKEIRLKLQEQELSILKKEKELQKLALSKQILESNHAKQALALTREKLHAEQQKRRLEEMSKEKELQALRLNRQKLEQEKQRQTIALLETDRKLKEERLTQEAKLRKYGYAMLALCMLIIVVIAFSFFQKNRDNKVLQQQKDEILKKNVLLHQNEQKLKNQMHYLEQARKMMAEQKEQLEFVHNRVQESIAYAKQIQESILPDHEYLKQLYPDSYLIFMPKDVISGDFYWLSHHGNYQVIIVADCTGHGVPGGLITLVGHSLLTEALQIHKMSEPSEILSFLHEKLRQRFRYHESSRLHGMDLGICVVRKVGNEHNISYAGAKNTLWYVKEGKLEKLKGNRFSLGSSKRQANFDTYTLKLSTGDKIYISSDGFIDQPNQDRRRFGSAKFAECLQEWHHLPMEQQKKMLMNTYAEHTEYTEQRDDISLIGVCFN